jgi:hypothetical protein
MCDRVFPIPLSFFSVLILIICIRAWSTTPQTGNIALETFEPIWRSVRVEPEAKPR